MKAKRKKYGGNNWLKLYSGVLKILKQNEQKNRLGYTSWNPDSVSQMQSWKQHPNNRNYINYSNVNFPVAFP